MTWIWDKLLGIELRFAMRVERRYARRVYWQRVCAARWN